MIGQKTITPERATGWVLGFLAVIIGATLWFGFPAGLLAAGICILRGAE